MIEEKQKNTTSLKKKIIQGILNTLLFFVLVALILVCIFKLVYIETEVEGTSMYPTINAGAIDDVAYINRLHKGDIGDIVVYDTKKFDENGKHKYIIKRLIATAGMRVDFKIADDNEIVLYIDGKKIDEPYVKNKIYKDGENLPRKYRDWQTYLKSINYENYNENGLLIKEGEVFLLGDNRANSQDSATEGPYKLDNLIGRVDVIVKENENVFSEFFEYLISLLS